MDVKTKIKRKRARQTPPPIPFLRRIQSHSARRRGRAGFWLDGATFARQYGHGANAAGRSATAVRRGENGKRKAGDYGIFYEISIPHRSDDYYGRRLKRHRSLDRQAKIPRHCTRRIVIKALPAGFQGGPQMARQIFCGREADALGSAAKSCGRKPLPENRVGHSARNSPRKTFNLRENCREGRRTPRSGKNVGAGRRAGGRQQPDFHYNSVPQGRRLRRKPHRLRGRLGVKIRLLELEGVEMTKLFLPKKRNAQ